MNKINLIRLLAYLVLLVFLSLTLYLIYLFQGQLVTQITLVSVAIGFYVFWGVWLHKIEDRLHHSLVVEYILLALLAGLLVYIQLLFI